MTQSIGSLAHLTVLIQICEDKLVKISQAERSNRIQRLVAVRKIRFKLALQRAQYITVNTAQTVQYRQYFLFRTTQTVQCMITCSAISNVKVQVSHIKILWFQWYYEFYWVCAPLWGLRSWIMEYFRFQKRDAIFELVSFWLVYYYYLYQTLLYIS